MTRIRSAVAIFVFTLFVPPAFGQWTRPQCTYDRFDDTHGCSFRSGILGIYASFSAATAVRDILDGSSSYSRPPNYSISPNPRITGDYFPGSQITLRVDSREPAMADTIRPQEVARVFEDVIIPQIVRGKTLLIRHYEWPNDDQPINQEFTAEGFRESLEGMELQMLQFVREMLSEPTRGPDAIIRGARIPRIAGVRYEHSSETEQLADGSWSDDELSIRTGVEPDYLRTFYDAALIEAGWAVHATEPDCWSTRHEVNFRDLYAVERDDELCFDELGPKLTLKGQGPWPPAAPSSFEYRPGLIAVFHQGGDRERL